MSSQNRAANGHFKQLALALDITSHSTSTEPRNRRPLARREASPHRHHHREAVARIDLTVYAQSPDEAGTVQIHWGFAGEEASVQPRVNPMQNCPGCDRGFRAPEPGPCRDCREGANGVEG